jgi:hypothetical protein
VAETARDTLAWLTENGGALPVSDDPLRPCPISLEREAELLRAWHARRNSPSESPC